MAQTPMKIPIYVKGTLEQLNHALTEGAFKNLDRVMWAYITEGERAGSLILVYTDKTYHYVTDGQLAAEVAELAERVQANSENIEQINGTLETVSETLSAYADWAETVNNSLSALRTDLDALEGRVGTAETTIAQHGTRLDGLDTDVAVLGTRMTAAEAGIIDLGSRTAAVESSVQEQSEKISDIEDILDDEEMGGQTVPEYVAEQMEDLKQEIEDAFDVEFI